MPRSYKEDRLMAYVTQGTVQVELKPQSKEAQSETAIEIRINPVQEFTVKYRKKDKDRETDYIVFMPDNAQSSCAKVFEKVQPFTFTPASADFVKALTDAALRSIKIEIKGDFPPADDNPSQGKTPPKINIVSIKVPATLRSDTV